MTMWLRTYDALARGGGVPAASRHSSGSGRGFLPDSNRPSTTGEDAWLN